MASRREIFHAIVVITCIVFVTVSYRNVGGEIITLDTGLHTQSDPIKRKQKHYEAFATIFHGHNLGPAHGHKAQP